MSVKKHELFNCPICNEIIGPWSRGITFHAKQHDMTLEDYWLLVHPNIVTICKCGCGKQTNFKSWHEGYTRYLTGHYDKQIRSKNTSARLKKQHWFRGKTKETDDRLCEIGKKVSSILKKRYANGEIKHWSKGKTAVDCEIIARAAKKRSKSQSRDKHWKWYSTAELHTKIQESCDNKFIIEYDISMLDERINNTKTYFNVTCTRCKTQTKRSIFAIIRYPLQCSLCDRQYQSKLENDVYKFVCQHTDKVYQSAKIGNIGELDIFMPLKKFAIEVNGLYWHSEAVQNDKNYHDNKTKNCRNRGYMLFHLFEDEWLYKRDIVKSMILHRLGKTVIRYFARKCVVNKIDRQERKQFLDTNHIDGDVAATIAYGLKYDNELVAVASFRKPFHTKWKGYTELARYAVKCNTAVPGGLGKLCKHYCRLHKQPLIAYQDTRHGVLNAYSSSGFEYSHKTPPRFWWTDKNKRFNRFSVRAQDGIPEAVVANNKKMFKIWGTSNLVWTYKLI